jgi:ABC-2 type transport system permease protein
MPEAIAPSSFAESWRNVVIIARRELGGYFGTPLAYVFAVVFVALTGAFAFFVGGFFDRGQADLQPFFNYHPWLYLLLVPAIAMRLWAEERKSGTIELLMTLPVSTGEAVVGKFLAAWAFIGIALMLTFPMWITVNVLGKPDNGVILASYIGSWLTAGAFLAIGSCLSALTKNQVIAFIVASAVCFIFAMSGTELVLNVFRPWAPRFLIEIISSLSVINHYGQITKGVLNLSSLIFYLSLIAFWLFANVVVVDQRKAA